MSHRTQLNLEDHQYRWLKRRAGSRGSIAGVVRDLIDEARARGPGPEAEADPLIRYLIESEGATEALAFDRHFAQRGLTLLGGPAA